MMLQCIWRISITSSLKSVFPAAIIALCAMMARRFRELTPEERDTVENALPSERRTGSLRWVRRPGPTVDVHVRDRAKPVELFDLGTVHLPTGAIHTVKPLDVDIPKGRLTAVTGVSDSGKITLILESLVPGPPPQGLVSPR